MSITNNAINITTPAPLEGAVIGASALPGAYGFNYYSIPGKNRIVNGDFSIMQAGGFTGGNQQKTIPGGAAGQDTYCFDRWQLLCSQNCTATQLGVTNTGSVIGLGYYARIGRVDGQAPSTTVVFGTTIIPELAAGMNGNPLTQSFLIRKGPGFSGVGNILTVSLLASTGTTLQSGLTNSWTEIYTQDLVLTATFTNVAFTLSAQTAAYLQFALKFSYITDAVAAANDYFELANVQSEISPKQTPFEYVLPALQLLKCQRYYYKSFEYDTLPASGVAIGAVSGDRIAAYPAGSPVGNIYSYMGINLAFRYPVTLLQVPVYVQLSLTGTLRIYNPTPGGGVPNVPLGIGTKSVNGAITSFTPQIESSTTKGARFLCSLQPGNTNTVDTFGIPLAHFTVFADVV